VVRSHHGSNESKDRKLGGFSCFCKENLYGPFNVCFMSPKIVNSKVFQDYRVWKNT
jgi:hypothetical protein